MTSSKNPLFVLLPLLFLASPSLSKSSISLAPDYADRVSLIGRQDAAANCQARFPGTHPCALSNCDDPATTVCCCCPTDRPFPCGGTCCVNPPTSQNINSTSTVPPESSASNLIETVTDSVPVMTSSIIGSTVPIASEVSQQSAVPSQPAGLRTIDTSANDPRIVYNPPDAWQLQSDNLPSCLNGAPVRVSSLVGSSFSFAFNGSSAYIRTILSPNGGNFSISVNGGPAEIFNSFSSTTTCGFSDRISPSGPVSEKVGVIKVSRRSDNDKENMVLVKNVGGETSVAGISYQQSTSSATRLKKVSGFLSLVAFVFICML